MENKILEILSDLYALDPSLRAEEKTLIPLIEKLIKAKPQTLFNEAFAAELKQRLLQKSAAAEQEKNMKTNKPLFNFNWKIVSYASVGTAALVLLVIATFSAGIYKQNSVAVKNGQAPAMKNQIVKIGRNAFGTIAMAKNQNNAQNSVQNSGAGALSALPNNNLISERALSSDSGSAALEKMSADSSIMPPVYGQIKYVYAGEDFTPPAGQSAVYKRNIGSLSDFAEVISAVKGLGAGIINLNNLKNLKLDSLSLREDREFGYFLNISADNMFSMYKNWEKWPNPLAKCQDEKCFNDNRLKLSDMPSDEAVLKIAKDFIAEYKINLSGYGDPVIQNSWRANYEVFKDKENYYFPEEVSVVYPMLIEGQEVHGQGGEVQGFTVNVDVRGLKAAGFNGVPTPSFEASEYDTVSEQAEIIKLAEAGGLNGRYYWGGAEGQEKEVKLGTPKLILMQYWQYNQETGRGEDLYLPAYSFPIQDKPENSFYLGDNVVVPLVKDIIKDMNQPFLLKSAEAQPLIAPAIAPEKK